MANMVKIDVIDQNGKSCDQSFHVLDSIHDPADAGIVLVVQAVLNMVDGGSLQYQLEVLDVDPEAGLASAGGYNAADKIHVVMKSSSDGAPSIIDIPCPGVLDSTSAPIFNVDGTVNQACPAVAAMISFLNANFLDTDGNACFFKSGHRTRSSRLRTSY